MKTKLTLFAVFLIFLCPFFSLAMSSDEQGILAVMECLWQNDIDKAIVLLNEGLKKNPQDVQFLKLRTQMLYVQGNMQATQRDVETLLELEPDNTGFMTYKCVLKENTGAETAEYLSCYRQIVEHMRKHHPEAYLEQDADYITALLLAKLPEAEGARQRFLNSLGDSPRDESYRIYFTNFHRNDVVIPPQARQ